LIQRDEALKKPLISVTVLLIYWREEELSIPFKRKSLELLFHISHMCCFL